MRDRLALEFAVSSALLLTVMGLAWQQNESREHRQFQRAFRRVIEQKAPALTAEHETSTVVQVWLPHFNRADRCMSCHLGVAEPDLRDAARPFGYHAEIAHAPADFNRFGCVSCHDGQGIATTRREAHGQTSNAPYPLIDGAHIEGRCGRCHLETAVQEAPGLTRGRALLMRYGCFNCHTAGGRELFPPDAPPLEGLTLKVSRHWLERWLRDPKAMDQNTRMPNFHLTDSEIGALSDYLLSLAPPPGMGATVRQAALEADGDPDAGAALFRASRCISCHTVDGKGHGSAPELSDIGSKTTRAWLLAFTKDTHALNPRTVMPAFQLTADGLRDIVSYMYEELREFDQTPSPDPRGRPAGVERVREGRQLFVKYGCYACHTRRQEQHGHEEVGPDLSAIADARTSSVDFGARRDLPHTIQAWLRAKVTEPRSFGPGLKMPSFALSERDVTDMITALFSLSREVVPEQFTHTAASSRPPSAPPPSGEVGQLFSKYRCLACHLVGEAGTDLSTAPLTFQGSKTKRDWLARYLVLPETIYPLLTERMPVLGITRKEAEQIADYISTVYIDDAITAKGLTLAARSRASAANGARLFDEKGCRACHIVGETGGYVGPPLTGTGDRLQSAWIAYWLENPQQWRQQARCPNYGLTPNEIEDLTAFLTAQRAAPVATP